MVYGIHSPVNWAQNLRSYGKQINGIATSLGYISWTDDGERLNYKSLELEMTDLKKFLVAQVEAAQSLLQRLLLVHPSEQRDLVVPPLYPYRLKDDPANRTPGRCFLDDPRNGHPAGYERWLLHRVLDESQP